MPDQAQSKSLKSIKLCTIVGALISLSIWMLAFVLESSSTARLPAGDTAVSASQDSKRSFYSRRVPPNTNRTKHSLCQVDEHPRASMLLTPDACWQPTLNNETIYQPLQDGRVLRVFIYESLPKDLTDDVTSCILRETKSSNNKEFSAQSKFMADVAIIQLFRTYPGRTFNPHEADIFVVPYPHGSHCTCNAGPNPKAFCPQVPDRDMDRVFESLTYYNTSSAKRHLFINSRHRWMTKPIFHNQHLQLTNDNLKLVEVRKHLRNHIVIPYLNDNRMSQSIWDAPDEWWTERPRKYSFTYVFGREGKSTRSIRTLFQKDWEASKRTTLANMPVFMHELSNRNLTSTVWLGLEGYRDSIFCPVLAGDTPQQARFSDVMYAGCIPVVMEFGTLQGSSKSWFVPWKQGSGKSWFVPWKQDKLAVYPFISGMAGELLGIDYDGCVLKVHGGFDIRNVQRMFDTMEQVILNEQRLLRSMQANLADCARRTLFAMGEYAHRYNDAFAQVIRMLDYYLQGQDYVQANGLS